MTKEFSSTTGTALAEHDDTTPASRSFAELPLNLIAIGLRQPRKYFNEAKLAELATSIKATGVHQPVLVRPLPGSRLADTFASSQQGAPRPTHELVAGERRYRASIIAGKATIPAMVQAMTDGEVREAQIIENLQREGLTELEESEGYDELMRANELTAVDLAQKIGKSREYVYARLKLLDLHAESRQALNEGKLDFSRALLIARVPDSKLQLKSLAFATDGHNGEQPSVRTLQTWLRQNVMLQLDRAPFQITDAQLIQAAGSCKTCPKRTGAAPDIFSDVDGADICTDPPCYNNKADTHRAQGKARAEAKGMRYIDGSEARAICKEKSSTLKGYSPLSQVRKDAGGQRLDKLLGDDIEGAVLIENPWTHELIEAVPTEETEGILIARGLVKAAEAPARVSGESYEDMVKKLKARTEDRITEEYEELVEAAMVKAVVETADDKAAGLLSIDVLHAHFAPEMRYYHGKLALEQLKLEDAHPDSLTSAQMCKFAVLYMAIENDEVTEALAKTAGVPLDDLREQAKTKVKVQIAAEIAALKKPPAPTPPLAQPVTLPAANAKTKKQNTPAAPRAAKLSAADALSGIAAAMQGIEGEPALADSLPVTPQPLATATQPPAAAPSRVAKASGDMAWPQIKERVAKPATQGTLAVGFELGQKVKVTSNTDNLGMLGRRFAGKTGTITRREDGGGFWDVTFRGRGGGIALFAEDQIEAVAE